jgi:hypothetical protein
MKEIIRHILKETIDKRKIAEIFLSRFDLRPWENKRYGMEYLATPGNSVIFLITKPDKELSVQEEIYKQLSRIFKDDKYLEEFIIEYVENYGLSTPYNVWISTSGNLGSVEDDDQPFIWDDEDN